MSLEPPQSTEVALKQIVLGQDSRQSRLAYEYCLQALRSRLVYSAVYVDQLGERGAMTSILALETSWRRFLVRLLDWLTIGRKDGYMSFCVDYREVIALRSNRPKRGEVRELLHRARSGIIWGNTLMRVSRVPFADLAPEIERQLRWQKLREEESFNRVW